MYVRRSYWEALSPADRSLHCMRALQHLHPTWVFAGPSAALVYGLEISEGDMWPLRLKTQRGENAYFTHDLVRMYVDDASSVVVDRLRVTSLELRSSIAYAR